MSDPRRAFLSQWAAMKGIPLEQAEAQVEVIGGHNGGAMAIRPRAPAPLTEAEYRARWESYPEAVRERAMHDATLCAALTCAARAERFDLAEALTLALVAVTDAKADTMRAFTRFAEEHGMPSPPAWHAMLERSAALRKMTGE